MVISPEHDLVVVLTSNLPSSKTETVINLGKTYILPAIETTTPLPENEEATANLKYEIDRFEKYEIE